MLSEQGLARAFSSFLGINTGLRKYKVNKSEAKIIVDKSVLKYRPCSAAAIVKGIKFTDELIKEIMQNQEKLHITYGRNRKKVALGYYILNKISFPVTYKAEEPQKIRFKPLHFEREITGIQILSQHPTGREFAYQLEGLDKFPVYYDSKGKVLSMPPIINSDESGNVLPGTCDILVECSGFDQKILNQAINMCVASLADMGGQIYSVEIEYPDHKITLPNMEPEEMKVDIDYINKRLGLKLTEQEIKLYLERMGYGYEKKKALIPAYRVDILHQIDLAEDIAIAYGYENFTEEIPEVATIAEESKTEKFIRRLANVLVGLDLLETNTYHLMSKDELNTKMCLELLPIELENAPADYNCLRNWMTPSLIKVLSENKHNDYPQKIFEIGTIFKQDETTETNVKEQKRLTVLTTHTKADYTEAKQILDFMMKALDLKYVIEETEHNSFIQGRVGRVIVEGTKVAYIGEIHPQVLENWKLEMPVSGFEINISELCEIVNKKQV